MLTELSSFTIQFLYAPAASYLSTYASLYSDHLLSSPDTLHQITSHIATKLDLTNSQWTTTAGPIHDLGLLTSLPLAAVLPQPRSDLTDSSGIVPTTLLFSLPPPLKNSALLSTLSLLFSGNSRAPPTVADWDPSTYADRLPALRAAETTAAWRNPIAQRAGARVAYLLYVEANPGTWDALLRLADVPTLREFDLPAIRVIESLIQARWAALPSSSSSETPTSTAEAENPTSPRLPTEPEFLAMLDRRKTPAPPADAITALLRVPALLTYLFAPPSTSGPNSSGGAGAGAGDTAAEIAKAKFALLQTLLRRLEGDGDSLGHEGETEGSLAQTPAAASGIESGRVEELKRRLRERIALGVFGGAGGGRTARTPVVATVER